MKKKVIYISIIIALVAIVFYKGFNCSESDNSTFPSISQSNEENTRDIENKQLDFNFISMMQYPQQDYQASINSANDNSFRDFMECLKTGKSNFVWEIWSLRDTCPENSSAEECNAHLIKMIETNIKFNAAEKEKLKKLFASYFSYENIIREIAFDKNNGPFGERYSELKKIRRDFFTDEDARLVFGMEESQVDFMEASADFSRQYNNLTGKEKIEKFESLKKEKLGPYYGAVVKREDAYHNAQIELNFMEEDFTYLSEEEKNRNIRTILEKHLGAAEFERMMDEAKKEEEIRSAKEEKINEYEAKERKLLSDNPHLSSDERERILTELRTNILGEEAENYTMKKNVDDLFK